MNKIKFCISSHVSFYEKTYPLIISSLLQSGILSEDIYFFIGGYNSYEKVEDSNGINVYTVDHNSLDFTGLISVLELNIQSEWWFLLHDTLYVGSNFYETIKNFNYENLNSIALTYDVSMNMGAYKWEYLLEKKDQILKYKNTNPDIQQYKRKLVIEEDIFLIPKISSYCNTPRLTQGPINYYSNDVPRIIEYFPTIDLYKIKANWERKYEYEIKL